ncbi:MAG: phosphoribosyltransferase [Methanomicrobiaceae archaeon]|nr:phosphoribosyltransferase [Methanomicrobiaceae archaeon]
MLPDSFPCELISWDSSYKLARILAALIKESGYRPDLVIAIGRGGFVPARVVCDFLLHEKLTSIKIEHWGSAAQKKESAKVMFPLSITVRGLRLLVVDDVTDTGETLDAAVRYLDTCHPAEIRTAVLQHKDTSAYIPDYYAERVGEWRWIIYPWAAFEDVSGFVGRVLSSVPLSGAEVRKALLARFGIAVSDGDLGAILSELVESGKAERTATGCLLAILPPGGPED